MFVDRTRAIAFVNPSRSLNLSSRIQSHMKKLFTYLLIPALLVLVSCELFEDVELTDEEVVSGLKEALRIGSENSVTEANATDGYYGNPKIRIPFPEEVSQVQNVVGAVPGGNTAIDLFVEKLNRTAEDAADEALPIFVDAITNMTIADGMDILLGHDSSATEFLRVNTYDDLKTTFRPDIENSLNRVGVQNAWASVTDIYNSIPLTNPVNPDLADYTTGEALDGLFTLVGEEEKLIREDPAARVTDLLAKVFAEQD